MHAGRDFGFPSPSPLSRMEREAASSAFGLRYFAGWLTLLIVSPLVFILIAVARDVQTPIITAILWARAKELVGYPVSEAVARHMVLEAARGVRRRDEARVRVLGEEAARAAAEAAEAEKRVKAAQESAGVVPNLTNQPQRIYSNNATAAPPSAYAGATAPSFKGE